ncbi:MAG: hypothetical protein Q9216_004107 [Gyalolechia sp. 2 TL-2023]
MSSVDDWDSGPTPIGMAHRNKWNSSPLPPPLKAPRFAVPDPAREELVQGFGSILKSGRGVDMTVVCQNEEFKYHSAIVCSRSTFFAAAVWGNFKVSHREREKSFLPFLIAAPLSSQSQQEAQTKAVKLPDENLLNVKRMMRYFYILDYNDDDVDEGTGTVFIINAQMYAMGDRFGVPGLKGVAAAKFERHCSCAGGKSAADQRQMDSLLLAIPTVYKSTPKKDGTLRDSVAGAFARDLLVNGEKWFPSTRFQKICRQFPDFIFDVLGKSVASQGRKKSGGDWRRSKWNQNDGWGGPGF